MRSGGSEESENRMANQRRMQGVGHTNFCKKIHKISLGGPGSSSSTSSSSGGGGNNSCFCSIVVFVNTVNKMYKPILNMSRSTLCWKLSAMLKAN